MTRSVLRIAALLVACGAAGPAAASSDGPSGNWALSEFGGSRADRQLLYGGVPGVLMGTSPASLLFVGWRRLHGLAVGADAGEALAVPCCASPNVTDASAQWLAARKTVPGVAAADPYLKTERAGRDYTSAPNCLADAFGNAVRTLQGRVASYGASSADVRFWVQAQDRVFDACADEVDSLPPLPDGAPDWLRTDYAYQSAALLFYNAKFSVAADAFAAVAADPGSPWHDIAPYLRIRALLRKALASKSAADFTAVRTAVQAVAATPFHAAADQLAGMAQLRSDPAGAAERLAAALSAPGLTGKAASDFRDLQALGNTAPPPDLLDWITIFKTGAAAPPQDMTLNPPGEAATPAEGPPHSPTKLEGAQAAEGRRQAALAHARDRYAATHDPAWMLAALALMQPDDATDAGFMADAASVEPNAPAFLTALYHRIRLTMGAADPAAIRPVLDGVLARGDLTGTTRNLFLAERLQVADTLADMARFALRARQCAGDEGCVGGAWGYSGLGAWLSDAMPGNGPSGVGDDARYLIDRMALASRVALSEEPRLPAPIRMDVALTSFARAVLLHDDATADRLARTLGSLLPAMAADFAAVSTARPGADKQFAQYMIFAKIPGLRADLLDYTRPVGAVAAYEGTWPNWVVLARPDPDAIAPGPGLYDNAYYQTQDVPAGTDLGGGHRRLPDPVCDGMCGAGGFVPRLPAFLAGTAARATAERRFLPPPGKYGDAGTVPGTRAEAFPSERVGDGVKALAAPPGAVYMWDAVLDYVAQHPQDPRAPEALHWLIHVGHFGQGHNHSGRRAFGLLKSRYPTSGWAKQNQFYYD